MAAWTDNTTADTYFLTRYDPDGTWAAATETNQTNSLLTAQADIENAGKFIFVDDNGETIADASATTDMENAVHEQALFLLKDADMEVRASLQAQGVTAAGVVQETYGFISGAPIAPRALQILVANDRALGSNDIDITK